MSVFMPKSKESSVSPKIPEILLRDFSGNRISHNQIKKSALLFAQAFGDGKKGFSET